ncbi:MAG: hypothetical protein HQK92_11725 [Nitrospirae bacterium]|nr:hypothetical protein [Nitrospirota bacterium]
MDCYEQTSNFSLSRSILLWLIIVSSLYISSLFGYLVFHTFAEMFSVVIAFCIFTLSYNTRKYIQNNYLYFLGITYFFVGCLDILHTLTYKGMNVIPGKVVATELWIATRYIESISLLIAPFFLKEIKIRFSLLFSLYLLITLLIFASIFTWNVFPVCYVEGVGLTPFKKISEYIICCVFAASLILLYKNKKSFDSDVLKLLTVSISFTIAAELCFTLYAGVYDFMNMVGHIFKVISYYFIYRAIIVTGMNKPFDLLFRDLSLSNKLNTERTRELSVSNEKLTEEIAHRKEAENKLESLNEQLKNQMGKEVEKLRQKEMLLIQQSKLAFMGEMIAAISHQWKQPLNALGLMIQNLYDSYKYEELNDEYFEKTVDDTMKQIDFMSKTVDDFRNFFKPSKGKETFDMIGIAADVFSLFSSQIRHIHYSITCHTHNKTFHHFSEVISCDATVITTYRNQLAHVILNIIKNANDALEEKRHNLPMNMTPQYGNINIECYKHGNRLIMEISDNAGGIPEEIIDRIFEPYFTTKEKSSGTGIGLYMSKIIIENSLGGKISVKNIEGGARFTLEFNA